MGGRSKQVQDLINQLQTDSQIPLLVAANCDSGGNGACADGTYIASGAQAEASRDTKVAYNAGLVSGREASALGVNVNFDPCVDILFNWRNTIVNTRAYGTNAEDVIRYSQAYLEGLTADCEMMRCIKHFPGDGVEERDQHLVLGVNDLSPEEWDDSFGRVYQYHIDNGVEMIAVPEENQPQPGGSRYLAGDPVGRIDHGFIEGPVGLQRHGHHRCQPHVRHVIRHAP